ncbi:hypothetical protein FSPOR_11292 [Fusarium sporotrichioides]|uniref:Uncharacterized protein n=1 Tax=Fusarium sporotrichioides TaxID=5514 RepID=A0A395RHH0_FUSSP|nr:hypothetical protein FSPOR_11292 [Fusarium sporotrichioides]
MDNPTVPHDKNLLLKQHLLRWASNLDSDQSPEEAYRERLEKAKANYQDASRTYDRGGSVAVGLFNDDSSADAFEVVFRLANEYKRVRDEKEAVRQQEFEYQQKLMEERKSMLRELLDILGQSVCDQVIVGCAAGQQALLTPMQEEAEEESQPTNTTADFPSSPVLNSVQQPPTTALPTMSSPPVADEARDPDISSNEPQRPTESDSSIQQGEREMPSRATLSEATNHVQDDVPSEPLTNRTVKFDQVYQDGNAAFKYVIDKYKGRYYIVECKKHKMHFSTDEAIKGARKHLQGKRHNPSRDGRGILYAMAIAEFGTEVLGCTDDLKDLNNKGSIIVKRKRRNRMVSHPNIHASPNIEGTLPARADYSHHTPSTVNTHQSRTSHIYPQLGEVYKGFWRCDRRFYAVLMLPLEPRLNFSQCLIPGPSHYKQLGDGSLELHEDYKPGGSKESKRQYPVVFFHKAEFPFGCRVGWIGVCDLEAYDPADDSIEHKHRKQVSEFLLNRGSARNAAIQESIDDENVPSPTPRAANPEGLPDRPTSEHHPCPEVEQRETEKEKSPEPPFADAPDVVVSDGDGLPTHQCLDRPPYGQFGDEMDVDIQVDNANLSTITTLEEGISHEERQALLEAAYSLTDTTQCTNADQEFYDVPMGDDTQTSPVYTQVPVSPFSAAAQAQAALEQVLASSTPEATPRKHYSFNHASQSPLSNRPEPYNVKRDADHDSLASITHTQTDQFEVSQSTGITQRTLHNLCYRLNGLSTIEEHGELEEPHRNDGGTMWTSAETPNRTPSRVSQSSYAGHRRRRRRPVSCFIPRRR